MSATEDDVAALLAEVERIVDGAEDRSLAVETADVAARVSALIERAEQIAALRQRDGGTLGRSSREALEAVYSRLAILAAIHGGNT